MSSFEPPAPPPPPPGPPGPPGPPSWGPPGESGPWDVGQAVSWGWEKFQRNMSQMIIAALAIFAAFVVFSLLYVFAIIPASSSDGCSVNYTTGDLDCDDGWPFLLTFAIVAVLGVVFFIFAQVIGAGLIREALGVTEGRAFTTAGVFKFENIGNVVVTSLLVGAGTFVGYLLCIIPGIIFAFLSMYSLFFVVDRNLAPVEAIKASIELVRNNLGPALIWYLVAIVIVFIGELLCLVGLLAAIPVALLGSAYTYKRLSGQPVTP
ncbi:hypothetical protein [Nocardioides sp. LML1-1-1.1]|uniref:hypothetical protein n=1 Tax=Nocardioides sp. LML1-1-1.1 TaxID=3135248 RepID=UPI00343D564B